MAELDWPAELLEDASDAPCASTSPWLVEELSLGALLAGGLDGEEDGRLPLE